MKKFFPTLLLLVLFAVRAQCECLLRGVQFLETGSYTTDMIFEDFNRDGHMDVAIAGKEAGLVRVFQNAGDGSFLIATEKRFKNSPAYVRAADFNGDTLPDLAVAGSGAVSILMNKGSSKFTIENRIIVNNIIGIAASDFNSDSLSDLAVLGNDGIISVFMNTNGAFRKGQVLSVKSATDLIAVPLGAGRVMDLVVSSSRGTISVFKGSAAGIFKEITPVAATPQAKKLIAGFINDDQAMDLVVTGTTGDVSVMLGLNETQFKKIQLATPLEILGMTLADFDNDKRTDLLFVNRNSRAFLYAGNGKGSFAFKRNYSFSLFSGSIITTDFNGDKNVDLVASEVGAAGVYFGNGKNNFVIGARTVVKKGGNVFAGDFDGDGSPDMIISGSDGTLLLRGKGNGSFYPSIRTTIPTLGQAAVSDLNADGRADVAGFDGFDLKVWLSTDDFRFKETASLEFPSDPVVQILDLNNDAMNDIAVISPNTLRVFINKGGGNFEALRPVFIGYEDKGILVDLNGDNIFDLVGLRDSKRLTIYLGAPNLDFGKHSQYLLDSCSGNVSPGDANADGKMDLVIGSSCDSRVTLFLGDGTGNLLTPQKIPAGGSSYEPTFADFNGDGRAEIFALARDPAKPSITLAPDFENYFLFGPFYWNRIVIEDFNRDGHLDLAASSFDSTALFLNCE